MAQSSPRPSTRGLTRSLKVNLPTPWDVKTAYDPAPDSIAAGQPGSLGAGVSFTARTHL
jgi:hypothetical protein